MHYANGSLRIMCVCARARLCVCVCVCIRAFECLFPHPILLEYRFFNLAFLWLNDNLLTRVTPLTKNCHLTEIYLHNNRLTSISGVFKRLFCLETLFLHNNQLRNLDETIEELKPLKGLRTLNLFHNPLAQEENYREKVLYIFKYILFIF